MKSEIKQVSPVEYEFHIHLEPSELEPEVEKQLREYRKKVTMKGFRPGKVPLSLVRKLYGQGIAYEVGARMAQEIFHEEVEHDESYRLFGQPVITHIVYKPEEGLDAVIRFEVLPEVELKDLSEIEVTRPIHEVTEEEVEEELERIREQQAEYVPVEEPAGEEDVAVVDIQEIDTSTGAPIIGQKQEEQEIPLGDPRLKESFKSALVGKRAGETAVVEVTEEGEVKPQSGLIVTPGEEAAPTSPVKRYELRIRQIKRKRVPELTDEWIQELTEGGIQTLEEFREKLEKDLEEHWEERMRRWTEGEIVRKLTELHPVPVPPSLVERYLDAMMEDLKRELGGQLPPQFDEAGFRAARREDAERQARWALIRDRIVEEEQLEVTEEDLQVYFEQQAAETEEGEEPLSPDMLRQFYEQLNLMDSLRHRLLTEKVLERLQEKMKVVERPYEEVLRELEAAQEEEQASEVGGTEGTEPSS